MDKIQLSVDLIRDVLEDFELIKDKLVECKSAHTRLILEQQKLGIIMNETKSAYDQLFNDLVKTFNLTSEENKVC